MLLRNFLFAGPIHSSHKIDMLNVFFSDENIENTLHTPKCLFFFLVIRGDIYIRVSRQATYLKPGQSPVFKLVYKTVFFYF